MKYETIQVNLKDKVALVTLNRAEKKNALSPQMVRELSHAFGELELDELVRCVVITGAGDAFCAGADLTYLKEMMSYSRRENVKDSRSLMELFYAIYTFPHPVIAAVNGPALAGGCGLATVCDIIIASEEKAKFGYTEVKIGFIPAIVLNFLIRRVGTTYVRELVLTGDIIDAQRALEIHLINDITPHNKLLTRAIDIAKKISTSTSTDAINLVKKMLRELEQKSLLEGLEFAVEMNALCRQNPSCQYGIECFLNKERPKWD